MIKGPEHGCLEAQLPRGFQVQPEVDRSDQALDEVGRSQLSFQAQSPWRVELDQGHEGEGVIFRELSRDELPMNVALAKALDSISPRELDATIQYHLELAREFDGPGGP